MNFWNELAWRKMLQDATPGVEAFISEGSRKAYIGFDPTAPSLTIGNLVQIMILKFWQRAGHTPIVLLGGATGSIGDPSGKDQERSLKSMDELEINLNHQRAQIEYLLEPASHEKEAIIINNIDFYKDMSVLDFLRNVGKNLTVNYMMSKDSVKNRLETGISFTEFSYQLLQAYDFQCLYKQLDCRVQMGGSDQWGNITSGTEFIRRNLSKGKAYAITTPLLTKSDGSKFGKSTEGNIWIDPKLTSPYKFYQFLINIDDKDLGQITRYFSLKSREEIESLENTYQNEPRTLKTILAEELTSRIHSKDQFKNVQSVSELLFGRAVDQMKLNAMSEASLDMVSEEIPTLEISTNTNIEDVIYGENAIFKSKSEMRRAVKNNAVSLNKVKVRSEEIIIGSEDWLHGRYILIENGKKNKYLIKKAHSE